MRNARQSHLLRHRHEPISPGRPSSSSPSPAVPSPRWAANQARPGVLPRPWCAGPCATPSPRPVARDGRGLLPRSQAARHSQHGGRRQSAPLPSWAPTFINHPFERRARDNAGKAACRGGGYAGRPSMACRGPSCSASPCSPRSTAPTLEATGRQRRSPRTRCCRLAGLARERMDLDGRDLPRRFEDRGAAQAMRTGFSC